MPLHFRNFFMWPKMLFVLMWELVFASPYGSNFHNLWCSLTSQFLCDLICQCKKIIQLSCQQLDGLLSINCGLTFLIVVIKSGTWIKENLQIKYLTQTVTFQSIFSADLKLVFSLLLYISHKEALKKSWKMLLI